MSKLMNFIRRGMSAVSRTSRGVKASALALTLMFLGSMPSWALDIVTQDGTTGDVTFDPTALTTPITGTIIQTVSAVAVIVLVIVGVGWMYRLVKKG